MKINSACLHQAPKAITSDENLHKQKKQNICDYKERSTLRTYLIEPLKVAGCGYSLYHNIPKMKGSFYLPTTIFVATGICTLTDIGLKRYDGYNKLSSYFSKNKIRQQKISCRLEKTVERLSFGLQMASLYFIFKNRLRKKATSIPTCLVLRPNLFTFPIYKPQNMATALCNPIYTSNSLYGNAFQEKDLLEFSLKNASVTTRKKDCFEVTYYKMATDKFLELLITPSDLKDPKSYLKNLKNSYISSAQEKMDLIEKFKKKFIENLAYLLNVVKSQVESYFVKI